MALTKYKYKARDKAGNIIKGEVEGTSDVIAARLVRDRGYIVLELKSSNKLMRTIEGFTSRVPKGDIVNFTRQMATMINAGLPVTESLSILKLQSRSAMGKVVSQILADVEGGESLSKAVDRHKNVFSPTYVALIRAGEAGGVLDKVLERLADNMEKAQEFRGKVKGAMIYPVIIIVGMLGVSVLMILFIIPRLTDLYDQFGIDLPPSTQFLIGISDFVLRFWYLVIAGIGTAAWAFSAWAKTENGKRRIAAFIFKIPIVGSLTKQVILTEITRTLALMQGAGVPVLEGITVTADVVGNVIIREALLDVAKKIEKGFPISYAFAQHPDAFPYILAQMISVGEETGKMEEVLTKVAHVFEVDSDQKVKALTASFEPIIMIFLGIGVGFLVVSVILPIYNLTSAL